MSEDKITVRRKENCCPFCGDSGKDIDEGVARCEDPTCRIRTFER